MLYLVYFPPALFTAVAFTQIFRIVFRRVLKRPPTLGALGSLSFVASGLIFVLFAEKPFTHAPTDLMLAVTLYVPAQAIASAFDWLRARRHAAIISGD
jgi:hypothetical protein